MSASLLPRLDARALAERRDAALDPDALRVAGDIEQRLAQGGERALREIARELGDLEGPEPLVIGREALAAARDALPGGDRERLERVAARIRRFAAAQRAALSDLSLDVPGGRAGHRWVPVDRAGCYAPGGRFPLPSSVLMTAIPAAEAGVREIWVASPHPDPLTQAAAAVAGCSGMLRVGGAQAVFALARGLAVPACDVIVGPGNRYVTAAKARLAGRVPIDSLAGPSELVVVTDGTADPDTLAADVLAQAEHDPDAMVIVVTLDEALIDPLERALQQRLHTVPEFARSALGRGGIVVAREENEAVALVDRIAPEHLEIRLPGSRAFLDRVRHAGAAFLGPATSTVLGDYGIGPNHTLPTGGAARGSGGLSVLSFLRLSTWVEIDRPREASAAYEDAAWFARQEGLEGHARAAERRVSP